MYISDVHELSHLFLDLLHDVVVTGSHDCDPGDGGLGSDARRNTLDVISPAGEQAGNTAQYARIVVYKDLKHLFVGHFTHFILSLHMMNPIHSSDEYF